MAHVHRISSTELVRFVNALQHNQLVIEIQPIAQRHEGNEAPVFRSKMPDVNQQCPQNNRDCNKQHEQAFIQLNYSITWWLSRRRDSQAPSTNSIHAVLKQFSDYYNDTGVILCSSSEGHGEHEVTNNSDEQISLIVEWSGYIDHENNQVHVNVIDRDIAIVTVYGEK